MEEEIEYKEYDESTKNEAINRILKLKNIIKIKEI